MSRWLKRILKGLVVIFGIIAILVIGLFVYVQVGWDRPFDREVVSMNPPRNESTVARGAYLYNEAMFCLGLS